MIILKATRVSYYRPILPVNLAVYRSHFKWSVLTCHDKCLQYVIFCASSNVRNYVTFVFTRKSTKINAKTYLSGYGRWGTRASPVPPARYTPHRNARVYTTWHQALTRITIRNEAHLALILRMLVRSSSSSSSTSSTVFHNSAGTHSLVQLLIVSIEEAATFRNCSVFRY